MSALTQSLLREFVDVFSNELPPGLPPLRGILAPNRSHTT